jgi:endonuclease/exonuclease/phosphatase (EEP) superfamily protein YafD
LLLTPLYDQYWQLPMSEVLGSWAYAPLLLLLPLAALTRGRYAGLALLIPLCFFGGEYGRQFLPNWPRLWSEESSPVSLRVMTWNTLFSIDHRDHFIKLVERLQPDIIALQEISYQLGRRLPETLQKQYPYQHIYAAGSTLSLAMLSRYPILVTDQDTRLAGCHCLEVQIKRDGRTITLINVHVWRPSIYIDRDGRFPSVRRFDPSQQKPIFDALLTRIGAIQTPLLVMGDFNTGERQPNYRRLRQVLEDAFVTAGWGMGYTYPANLVDPRIKPPPFVRIDHIFYNNHWQAQAAWSGRLPESDHGFVVADLALR